MPTRRLAVKVQRSSGLDAGELEEHATSTHSEPPQPRGRVGVSVAGDTDDLGPPTSVAGGADTSLPSDAAPKPQRQPYVPRSVRMRGRQQPPGPSATGSSGPSGNSQTQASPAMNFYTFEAQWT